MPLHHSPPGRRPPTLAVGVLLVLLSSASQAETWVITDKAHPVSATGSINLEQQRKRAKELLRQWRRDPASRTGLPGQEPRLADAQWQVARELGFASWPRLKAHVDAIAFASRHPDLVGGDEAATLHLRCGNDIAHGLKLAGFRSDFRMFADPLTMGPVPNLPLPEFLALRSDYLSRAFDLDPADAQARQRQEYAGLERLGEYSRVALWCEADAYDQLFLVRVLAGMQTPPEHLELIEIDRVPGVERFVGIGQLAPELLAWLWTRRRPLDAEALALARAAWDAYRDRSTDVPPPMCSTCTAAS